MKSEVNHVATGCMGSQGIWISKLKVTVCLQETIIPIELSITKYSLVD